MCVLQAQLLRLIVHLGDELVHATVPQVLGQGVDRVGAGRYQGRREEVPGAHAVVGVEADVAVDGAGVGGCFLRDGYLLVMSTSSSSATRATMILVVEAIETCSSGFLPAR